MPSSCLISLQFSSEFDICGKLEEFDEEYQLLNNTINQYLRTDSNLAQLTQAGINQKEKRIFLDIDLQTRLQVI